MAASSSISDALPNRLVDFFCVISPGSSPQLDPKFCRENPESLKHIKRVEDLLLAPSVTDCYPDSGTHASSMEFPQHVASFVFPEGCRPSSNAPSPVFFTFVLTCSDGSRLYGGALKLHDKTLDMDAIKEIAMQAGYDGGANGFDENKALPSWLLNATRGDENGVHIIPEEEEDEEGFNLSLDQKEEEEQKHERKPSFSSVVHSDIAYLPKCLVVLSHYPFFDLWRKFLLQIYRIALVEAPLPIERFIANFVSEVPLPPPGKVEVRFGFTAHEIWSIRRPPNNELPLVDFSFQPLFASLSVSSVMVVLACLLEETRVALLSKHYAILTPVAEALCSLLFPFHWQGMYIPIMPYSMLDILDAPVPFLVGLHSRYLQETPPTRRPPGVVFVDLDQDIVHLGWNDDGGAYIGGGNSTARTTPALPEKDAQKLKSRLAASASSVYILPESGKAGSITCAEETPLPFGARDSYCLINSAEVPNTVRTLRRKEIWSNVDRAYNDNEMYIPVEDFMSGQGLFHEKKSSSSKLTESPRVGNKRLRFVRRLLPSPINTSRSSNIAAEDDDASIHSSIPTTTTQSTYLLDVKEPSGFSVDEIRTAFLKFFVGILKNYREYINEETKTFDSEMFLASKTTYSERSQAYLKGVMETQLFERFMQERIECPTDSEVMFFDTSIDAKQNKFQKTAPFKKFRPGGKKDTSFLDDKSKVVTEKFTPPPPSNSGLPDDGRTYHYGSFPDLDLSLYGKVRPPIVWPEFQSKGSIRSHRRTASEIIRKQQLLVDGLLGSTQGGKTSANAQSMILEPNLLERSLYALSKPFMTENKMTPSTRERAKSPMHRGSDQGTGKAHNKSLTLNSKSPPTTPTSVNADASEEFSVEAAQEVVLSARRKVSILVGIFVVMQARSRGYVIREKGRVQSSVDLQKKQEAERATWYQSKISKYEPALITFQQMAHQWLERKTLLRQANAATKIQTRVRSHRLQVNYVQLKFAMIMLQARIRSRRTKFAYQLLLLSVSKVQARYRGYGTRVAVQKILAGRLKLYRRQIFILWKREHTSLAFRAKMWMILQKSSFIRHNVAESELRRLWNELQLIEDPDVGILGDIAADEVSRLSSRLRVANGTYAACLNFNETLEDDREDDFSNVSSLGSVSMSSKYSISSPSTDRGQGVSLLLSSERTQIYERLSRTSTLNNDQVMRHYDSFNIGMKEKKRKKSLAEAMWRNLDQVDASAMLMFQLFPELEYSDNLQFVEPSKKGMRRFHFDFKPAEAETRLRAQKMFDDRVRYNVSCVASIAMLKVPKLMEGMETKTVAWERRKHAIMGVHHFDSWKECRFKLMQSLVESELLGTALP
uniref:UDENN domain-containing protein n=1 Tax=Entomoneis paludosa TaxID=265537 RepID=A0A7S2Y961_9STRA